MAEQPGLNLPTRGGGPGAESNHVNFADVASPADQLCLECQGSNLTRKGHLPSTQASTRWPNCGWRNLASLGGTCETEAAAFTMFLFAIWLAIWRIAKGLDDFNVFKNTTSGIMQVGHVQTVERDSTEHVDVSTVCGFQKNDLLQGSKAGQSLCYHANEMNMEFIPCTALFIPRSPFFFRGVGKHP